MGFVEKWQVTAERTNAAERPLRHVLRLCSRAVDEPLRHVQVLVSSR